VNIGDYQQMPLGERMELKKNILKENVTVQLLRKFEIHEWIEYFLD
jgi:hypothetical protein